MDRLRWPRLLGALVLAAALWGIAATCVVWRADAAARRGDYAAAVGWRPAMPLYHRLWAEALLLRSPAQAERQLRIALRLDPDDPIAVADLSTVELSLGGWSRALTLARRAQSESPDFANAWNLVNLDLVHGDLAGYWQGVKRAAALAAPADFPSIVARSLAASHRDFATLRRSLPADSVAAASAYLDAAVAAAQDSRAPAPMDAAAWLFSLPAPSDPDVAAARLRATQDLLAAAWSLWPDDVESLWRQAGARGLLPLPAKGPRPPFILHPDFSPAAGVPDALAPILAWQWLPPQGVRMYEVATGDAAAPTALELVLDGSQPADADIARQEFLAPAGAALHLQVRARLASPIAAGGAGLALLVRDAQGRELLRLPLALGPQWQLAQATLTLPRSPLAAYTLALVWRRPAGVMPLQARVLLAGAQIQ